MSVGGDGGWETFLESYSSTIDAVLRPFTRTYDERMDLFLEVCGKLRENDMRRVRKFQSRADSACRFETYLAVVVRNLAVDHLRSRWGRYRDFANVAVRDEADRLIVGYRFRDGHSLDTVRELISRKHGLTLDPAELDARIVRLEKTISASQRWRLFSRWASRQAAVPIEPLGATAESRARELPLASQEAGPDGVLGASDAGKAFVRAVSLLPGRQQLALVLRFRDGNDVATAARTIGVSPVLVERLTRDALASVRQALGADRISREDMEGAFGSWWGPMENRA